MVSASWRTCSTSAIGIRTKRWPKALPRVTGRGTRVIITEYDLPRPETQPHDVIVDKEGIVWYSDFSDQFLGRLDPKTLAIKEYPVPLHREGFPTGALDLEVGAHRAHLGDEGVDGGGGSGVPAAMSQGHQSWSGHQSGLLSVFGVLRVGR